MSLFQIDYLKKTGALMKEAFTLKKYKAMHPAFAIFVGIFMSPFLVVGLLLTAILAVFAFVCNLLLTPLKHIHSLFKAEAKDVKHATQFIIYAISWPIFFLLYFALSWLFIVVYLLYALLSISMYIFTLGGFKYHISPNFDSDDIAINVKGRFLALPIVTICVSAVLLIAMVVFGSLAVVTSVEANDLYDEYVDLQNEYNKLKGDDEAPANDDEAPANDDEAPVEEEEENNNEDIALAAEGEEDAAADEELPEEDAAVEEETEPVEEEQNDDANVTDDQALADAKAASDAAYDAYTEKFDAFIAYIVVAGAAAAIAFLTNMLMSLIAYAPRYVVDGECCCCAEVAAAEQTVEETVEVVAEEAAEEAAVADEA